MARKFLVTGGAGFIGSNFIRYLFEHEPDARVTNFDLLSYAGVQATVDELDGHPNHEFVKGDIRDQELVDQVMPGHDVVVHFAAETHVDRSITGPSPFLTTNVVGTGVLLDSAYRSSVPLFVHVSTDEVYGSISKGFAPETEVLEPSSPYSSSKAGSDLLALSYHVTHGLPAVVTRCTNNYGPYQFPEKVIPLFVTNLLEGKKLPLYGGGLNERDWLYVEDHCAAVHLLVDKGTPGEIYNIGANNQMTNIDLTRRIVQALGADESQVEYVTDRPGHDFRYAVDSSKVRALGWEPTEPFEQRLSETVDWYREREDWWRPLKETSR